MTSSLPEQYTFPLLSRLPPASFVVEQRDFNVAVQPSGGVYAVDRSHDLEIFLNGAPNEFALMGYATISGDTSVTADFTATRLPVATDGFSTADVRRALFQNDLQSCNVRWERGAVFINASRESVNAGQMPLFDHQDKANHLMFNNARSLVAKRRLSGQRGADLTRAFFGVPDIPALAGAGWNKDSQYKGINLWYRKSAATDPNSYRRIDNGVKHWEVPLGLYSSLAQTASCIPIGLLSSYSVNGYGIRVSLANLCDPNNGLVLGLGVNTDRQYAQFFRNDYAYVAPPAPAYGFNALSGTLIQAQGDGHRNIKISVPVVKVLDPAVMSSILALYEKRQMVSVGSNVSFPLSLRMNTIGYRTYDRALDISQGDYFFRLPTTDRSVRGLMMVLYKTTGRRLPMENGGLNCNKVTRLDVKIGSLTPLGTVIESRTPQDNNIEAYSAKCIKRSGHLFSPFPYWREALETAESTATYAADSMLPCNDPSQTAIHVYVISFENQDYREKNMETALSASGIDCTSVGGIDVSFRVNHFTVDPETAYGAPPTGANGNLVTDFGQGSVGFSQPSGGGSWRALFALAYDQVVEASPSGVMDITNAVL